ncbi:MAG: hypothetical protein ABEJ99_05960 [Candidatus Nanohaloarchaea archaeon]
MIVSRSPLRLSIGGGGTDLPFYYSEEGGYLVTATMDKYVYCIVKERFEKDLRISYSENEEVGSIEEIENDRARTVLERADLKEHLEVVTIADAPSGSGLGSSGAFTVGLLNATSNYLGDQVSNKELAEDAFDIEHNELGYPCGKQDQYAAAFGGIVLLEIDENGNTTVSPLDISSDTVDKLERNIQLFYTGQLRDSTEILEEQKNQVVSNEDKMEKMRRIKAIGKDIKEALENDEPDEFGRLLHRHWSTKKKFTEKMSNPEIDKAYERARDLGALGGKIMGAGGGGFFMFYVDENRNEFREKMEEFGLRYMEFGFDWDGTQVIYNGLS